MVSALGENYFCLVTSDKQQIKQKIKIHRKISDLRHISGCFIYMRIKQAPSVCQTTPTLLGVEIFFILVATARR